jgi:hypothetical protein
MECGFSIFRYIQVLPAKYRNMEHFDDFFTDGEAVRVWKTSFTNFTGMTWVRPEPIASTKQVMIKSVLSSSLDGDQSENVRAGRLVILIN